MQYLNELGFFCTFSIFAFIAGSNKAMRQLAAKPKQLAKTNSALPARPAAVITERKQATAVELPSTAALPVGFDLSRIPVHGQAPVTIQPKLTISTPGEMYEREAKRVADHVVRAPRPVARFEISNPTDPEEKEADDVARNVAVGHLVAVYPTSRDVNRRRDSPAGTTPEFRSRLERSRGRGQSLHASIRREMETKMEADFSDVKIHSDSEANQMNEDVNARAFTCGQDIFFKQGEFNTISQYGKELMAHELTHTAQNRGKASKVIQRRIVIDGRPHEPTKEEKVKYGEELLKKMHNGGQKPDYTFSSHDEFEHNLQIRANVIDTILAVIGENNRSVKFGFYMQNEEGKGEFRMPPQWKRTMRKEYHVTEGVTPAEAVNSIFNNNDEQTYLDCNAMLIAVQYKALLDTYGAERFNKMFPGGKNLIIGQNKMDNPDTPGKEGYQSTESGSHPLFDQSLYTIIQLAAGEDPFVKLLPGDWIYFKNADDYIEFLDGYHEAIKASTLDPARYRDYKHDGEWQGEHAIYLGDKKIQMQDENKQTSEKTDRGFAGFGIEEVKTYEKMISMMTKACKFEYKSMKLAQQNDFTTDANDFSDVPDSVIKGKPRISAIYRVNTANIEPLGK